MSIRERVCLNRLHAGNTHAGHKVFLYRLHACNPHRRVAIPRCVIHRGVAVLRCIIHHWDDFLSIISLIFRKKSKSSLGTSNGTRRSYLMKKTNTQKSCDTVPLKTEARRRVPIRINHCNLYCSLRVSVHILFTTKANFYATNTKNIWKKCFRMEITNCQSFKLPNYLGSKKHEKSI